MDVLEVGFGPHLSSQRAICVRFDATTLCEHSSARLGVKLPASLRGAAAKRKADFLAGRFCARRALELIGCPGEVQMGADGAPHWPQGVVGSITHSGSFAAALAARTHVLSSVGIDSEALMSSEAALSIANWLAHEAEWSVLRGLPLQHGTLVTLVFSAKESLYKCLFPLVGVMLDFLDVEIVDARMCGIDRGRLELRLSKDLSSAFRRGFVVAVSFCLDARLVHTCAELETRDSLSIAVQ